MSLNVIGSDLIVRIVNWQNKYSMLLTSSVYIDTKLIVYFTLYTYVEFGCWVLCQLFSVNGLSESWAFIFVSGLLGEPKKNETQKNLLSKLEIIVNKALKIVQSII